MSHLLQKFPLSGGPTPFGSPLRAPARRACSHLHSSLQSPCPVPRSTGSVLPAEGPCPGATGHPLLGSAPGVQVQGLGCIGPQSSALREAPRPPAAGSPEARRR